MSVSVLKAAVRKVARNHKVANLIGINWTKSVTEKIEWLGKNVKECAFANTIVLEALFDIWAILENWVWFQA